MMAPDPKADRLRLIIEPDDDGTEVPGPDEEGARQRRPEDMIDLDRLDDDDQDYDYEDEEAAPARRRLLPAGLAVAALLGFAAGAWYAYERVIGADTEEAIPLIQAATGPIKTRPAAPGGLEVPHQNRLVLNEITPDPDKPQVERLLPPPEVPKPPVAEAAPLPAPDDPAAPDRLAGADSGADSAGSQAGTGLAPAAGPLREAATAPPAAPQPGTQGADAAPKPAPAPAAPQVAAKAEPPEAPPTTPPAAPAPPREPAAAAPQPAQTAALTGGYLVQLASLKDKALAANEWARLQEAFPDLLADRKLVLQEADLGSRGIFHRVRAGYFPDQASAAASCEAFKAKDQACIVVRP